VNDTNSTEFIAAQSASRRVRRRPNFVTVSRDETTSSARLDARHDGYRDNTGYVHQRILTLMESGESLIGEERLSGSSSPAQFAVRFHLHPAVQASLTQDGQAVLLRLPGGAGWRFRFEGPAALALEQSIYSPDGVTHRRTMQLVLHGETSGPMQLHWKFGREKK
jgi:uncharacterized heparinase superfamily protein